VNAINFEINLEKSPEYVYIQTDGEASVRGFDELLTAIVESPNWITGSKQLVDHRKLKPEKLTSEDVRRIGDIVKKHAKKLGNGRCAFVVSDALGFGLVRMYESLGGEDIHLESAVFYTIDEAVEWLRD
jgi:hypothetical protein